MCIRDSLVGSVTEKLTAVVKSGSEGFWVIAHGWNNSLFYVYDLNCEGLNHEPSTFSLGSQHSGGNNNINAVGYMKASPNGKKLALINRTIDDVELFDFDNVNGRITNASVIEVNSASLYGIEFSTSNNFIFIADVDKIIRPVSYTHLTLPTKA